MFKKLVENAVRDVLPSLMGDLKDHTISYMVSHLEGIYKLDPKAQYIIAVKDDQTAQDLVRALNERFDPQVRIIVIAAEDVRFVEISKRRE